MAGPILLKSTAQASETTSGSYGPTFGVVRHSENYRRCYLDEMSAIRTQVSRDCGRRSANNCLVLTKTRRFWIFLSPRLQSITCKTQ